MSFLCVIFAVVRHEEIPGERESRTETGVPGQASPRVPMHFQHSLRQVRSRAAGQPRLGHDHQRGRSGHAQGQAASR